MPPTRIKAGRPYVDQLRGVPQRWKERACLLAGKPDQSLVLAYLKGDRQPRMPLGGEALSAEQIDLFRGGLQREESTTLRKQLARNW